MENKEKSKITVEVIVKSPVEKVWEYWTSPEHVINWNFASDEWHSPKAENDLRVKGKFNYRMEARDGSFGFDFWGIYDDIKENEFIAYTLGDERKVTIQFIPDNLETKLIETFEAESTNSLELQQNGWQAILNNFKKYAEVMKKSGVAG
ncbi:MAG: SRPBCC family protein [Spirochaetales bacterium]|nr:SRPBCC family protein [Spirochaetales bacterium]